MNYTLIPPTASQWTDILFGSNGWEAEVFCRKVHCAFSEHKDLKEKCITRSIPGLGTKPPMPLLKSVHGSAHMLGMPGAVAPAMLLSMATEEPSAVAPSAGGKRLGKAPVAAAPSARKKPRKAFHAAIVPDEMRGGRCAPLEEDEGEVVAVASVYDETHAFRGGRAAPLEDNEVAAIYNGMFGQ